MDYAVKLISGDVVMKYRGITYPAILDHGWVRAIWKRLCCPTEWHLFDEVETFKDHYLYCDACSLIIDIAKIDTASMEKRDGEN